MERSDNFKNHPTWVVATWIQRNAYSFSYWKKKAEESPRKELIRELKLKIEGIDNPLTNRVTMYSELLDYSFALVDWDEIVDLLKIQD